jgi:hypothetical protein
LATMHHEFNLVNVAAGLSDLPWEPKQAFSAVASCYATHETRAAQPRSGSVMTA